MPSERVYVSREARAALRATQQRLAREWGEEVSMSSVVLFLAGKRAP